MLKILSLNVEGDRHIDKISHLINKVNPDVICLQEAFEEDVRNFADNLNAEYFISEVALRSKSKSETLQPWGVGMIPIVKVKEVKENYYSGSKNEAPVYDEEEKRFHYRKHVMPLLSAIVEKDREKFTVASTHFMKSEGGKEDDFQIQNLSKLLDALEGIKPFVLCGDFNAPRGMKIFSTLSEKYKDNIDPKYETSLDPDLHRTGGLPYMVDGLFTTPEYKVTHMHFETGVSDHYAIVAEVEKVK